MTIPWKHYARIARCALASKTNDSMAWVMLREARMQQRAEAAERRESELSDLLKEKIVEVQRLRDQLADVWDDGAAAAFELLGMDHQDRLRNPHRDDDEAGA